MVFRSEGARSSTVFDSMFEYGRGTGTSARYPATLPDTSPVGPGLVTIDWEPCECALAQAALGGHIAVRCLHPRCEEEWLAPRHHRTNPDPLDHHRPGYRYDQTPAPGLDGSHADTALRHK